MLGEHTVIQQQQWQSRTQKAIKTFCFCDEASLCEPGRVEDDDAEDEEEEEEEVVEEKRR